MEEPRSTRHLKRAELAGASTAPTAPKRRRIAFVGEAPLELRSEEREGAPPLLLPYPDSPEKVSAPSESGEVASGDLASSLSSGSLEPPRSSARSEAESVDVAKEEKFDIVSDRPRQAKSFETEASTCNRDFRETTPSKSATMKPSPATTSERRPPASPPSRAELESFFLEAEERERRRFAEKYNYDVAMDTPLEGRYEWIRLKP
ncbi:cyclin-dependent kinase inhibitor 7 isoform X3 [Eucalyptus grandis]|uniref:cyclin-dependent kinase inhibitor 7 isoform X3 n=1 Tax=Eucalyptus grandis TaxID=71139 RepID=UPI00192EFE71|nr:cyclin-dependent kinase inhibitor 7 isoform X3 [Eucalyptus grandis]